MLLSRSCSSILLLLLAALAVAACSSVTPREELLDADAADLADANGDTAADTAVDEDTAAPDPDALDEDTDAPPDAVCGDMLCAADAEDVLSCPEDCATGPVFGWAPLGDEITAFPDDFLTVPDATTATGLRLDLSTERAAGLGRYPEGFAIVFERLRELDGFGTSAPLYLSFRGGAFETTALPADGATIADGSPLTVGWLDDEGTFHEVPVRAQPGALRTALLVRPMLPLPPGRQALVALRVAPLGSDGATIHANTALRSLLEGRAEGELARLQGRYTDAAAALVEAGFVAHPDELAALVVFTTGSVLDEGLRLGERVAAEAFGPTGESGCNRDNPRYVRCDFAIEAPSVRDAAGLADVPLQGPLARHTLPVVAYLPPSHPVGGPWPVLVFGHGLGGSRTQAARAAALVDAGWALVALDAPGHGDHPQAGGEGELELVLEFFGVELTTPPDGGAATLAMDPRIMRGSLVQGSADKLALEQALGDGLDLDGDGALDLDPSTYAYIGVSLGAIMAPQYLALSRRVGAAVLVAGGGRAVDVLADGSFGTAVRLAFPPQLNEADIDRFFVYAQTVIDGADGANFAPFVARDRFDGRDGIETLSGMALDDEVVPNSTTLYLARSLGGVQVEPALREAGLLPLVPTPVSANMPDGTTTGLLQIDWVNDAGTPEGWEAVDHVSVADSTVGIAAWSHFLGAWRDTGTAEIIDPWAALGLVPPR